MKSSKWIVIAGFAIILFGFTGKKGHQSALLQYDKQIDAIISQMTIE